CTSPGSSTTVQPAARGASRTAKARRSMPAGYPDRSAGSKKTVALRLEGSLALLVLLALGAEALRLGEPLDQRVAEQVHVVPGGAVALGHRGDLEGDRVGVRAGRLRDPEQVAQLL